jgi:hypothetical protein
MDLVWEQSVAKKDFEASRVILGNRDCLSAYRLVRICCKNVEFLIGESELNLAHDLGVCPRPPIPARPFPFDAIGVGLEGFEFVQSPKQGCLAGFVLSNDYREIFDFNTARIGDVLVHPNPKGNQLQISPQRIP